MINRSRHRRLSEEVFKALTGTSAPEAQLDRVCEVLSVNAGADVCLFRVQCGDPVNTFLQGFTGNASLWPEETRVRDVLAQAVASGRQVRWRYEKDTSSPLGACGLKAALIHPITWRRRPVAVLVAGFRVLKSVPLSFTRSVAALDPVLASLVRGIITRRYQVMKNEAAGELLRISERLSTAADVEDCFSKVARAACALTGAGGALLRTEERGILRTRSFFAAGLEDCGVIETPNDAVFADKAFKTGRTVFSNIESAGPVRQGGPAAGSLMCLPFRGEEALSGVLTLFDRRKNGMQVPFGRLHRETARALIRIGLLAAYHLEKETEVIRVSRSLEARVKELTLLHQISRAVLERNDVHAVLRSLLAAVTNVEDFGFDRAFLFLQNEEEKTLTGVLGVEATPVDAGEGGEEKAAHAPLDELISGFRVAVRSDGGVLPRTVIEKRSFRIRLPRDRELVSREVVRYMGDVHSFATVPLRTEERVLGVIWVDNLRTERPIRHDDLQLLISAAAQAGLAVERSLKADALETLNSKIMELQNRMIQWEKMAALGEMAASVAHDIRNPLVSIGGFTRRLKKRMAGDDRGVGYADIIIQEVDRLERTLDNVMSYSRTYGQMEKKPVDIYSLLTECAELFTENFRKKRVLLRRQFTRDLPEVELDERQIRQAVLNILYNAGEAAAELSEVTFGAEYAEKEGTVVISVSDHGEGIPEQDLGQVFQPFFTRRSTGTGLGLAIAQRAVSGHGGEIRVDNRWGEGVTFSIHLPTISPVHKTTEG